MTNKSYNLSLYIFFFFVILLFYKSMYLYYLWDVHEGYLSLVTALFGLFYYSGTKERFIKNQKYVLACVLFFIASYRISSEGNLNFTVLFFFKVLCVYLVLILPVDKKKELLRLITISFAIILGASLIVYLLVIGGASIPHYGNIYFNDGNYSFVNYGVYLRRLSLANFYRFNSVFLEPGHVAVIASYILFANEFKLKHNIYNILILIGTLFTLSLAGYVLIALGYFLIQFVHHGVSAKVKYSSILLLSLILFVGLASNYNNGNNYLNNLIVERLQFDKENLITGWNRTSDVADIYFDNMITNGDIWTGMGNKEFKEIRANEKQFEAAGYKPYLMAYGLIGAILIFLFYLLIASVGPVKKKLYLMLALYTISFLQRAYPEWMAWIIPFACSNWTDDIEKKVSRK